MTLPYKLGAMALIILSIYGYGLWQYSEGQQEVQTKWDTERSINDALARAEAIRQEKANEAIKDQHKKDIASATSTAGRDAVRAYIKSLGLLPQGTTVQANPIADSTKVADGASKEPSPSTNLEKFVLNCGLDAIQIESFRDWVKLIGFPIEK